MIEFFTILATIILFATLIDLINKKFFNIQNSIALTLGATLISLFILLAGKLNLTHIDIPLAHLISKIDFKSFLLNGILGFLLFAGAMTIDVRELYKQRWEVGILSTISTLISTALISLFIKYLTYFLGLNFSWIACLLFGALISPTDPIAVLATLKKINAPKVLETKIAGESLFNDGVGLVIFITFYQIAYAPHTPTFSGTLFIFLKEAIGGILYGYCLGFIGRILIRKISDIHFQFMLTLSIASAGYIFAQNILHISGPLAMVISGIMIGHALRQNTLKNLNHNQTPNQTPNQTTLSFVWSFIDEALNAILFLIIGLELIILPWNSTYLFLGLAAIPCVLIARLISVAIPMTVFKRYKQYTPFVITILTWGGLRGGLALAMALSLQPGLMRDHLLILTYCVVLFSIIIQGLSAKSVAQLSKPK